MIGVRRPAVGDFIVVGEERYGLGGLQTGNIGPEIRIDVGKDTISERFSFEEGRDLFRRRNVFEPDENVEV